MGHILWLESGCWRAIQDEMVDLMEPSLDQNVKSHSTHENNGDIQHQTSACVVPY